MLVLLKYLALLVVVAVIGVTINHTTDIWGWVVVLGVVVCGLAIFIHGCLHLPRAEVRNN